MKCQACGKHAAVTHVKTITNGELSEYFLCAECARRLGYGNLFAELGHSLNLLGFQPEAEERCPCCGAAWKDIVRAGRVGCPECYRTFYDRLLPAVQRMHGSVRHQGKTPDGSLPRAPEPAGKGLLLVKRRQLREAIDAEKFEDAAVLRDEIRALEGGRDE